jgi:hypothetical protein
MSLAEDEQVVGDLGAGGEDEPFRVGVRPRASWLDLADGDAGIGQYGVEGDGELSIPWNRGGLRYAAWTSRTRVVAARRFFRRALSALKVTPGEVVTDAAAVYPSVLDELIPSAWHHVEQYANNPIEADHGRLKHRLRPMRGLQTDRTAQVIIAGHCRCRLIIRPAQAACWYS